MRKLRPYQEQCVTAVTDAFADGLQRVYYVLPTGMGKTFTFVEIARRLGVPVLVLAHRKELLHQACGAFQAVDPSFLPQIEQGPLRAGRFAKVVAASVPTLVSGRRLQWFKPGLVVVDETHHVPAKSWTQVITDLGCFEAGGPKLVGCTATPSRTDAKSLDSTYEARVFEYTIRNGVEEGWLCDIRGYRVKTETDLRQVKTTAGDFNRKQLEEAVDVDERTLPVIRHWMELASDRPTLVFCAGVEHAKHVAQAYRDQGIRAEHVDGSMSGVVRDSVISRFKRGDLQVVTNDSVLTEGFDYPAVSCIVMMRPTQSWALYVQCIGRGTRLADGKADCIVIDAVDNCDRHNLATVPAILDLPSGLDLQGKSLKEAAKKVEQLGEAIGTVLAAQKSLAFADLDSILEQVDLLTGQLQRPQAAVEARCELTWVQVPDGFYVSLGPGRRGKIEARLQKPSEHDPWSFLLLEGGTVVQQGRRPADMSGVEALWLADQALRRKYPDAVKLASAAAGWRSQPASKAQLGLLKRLGFPEAVIASVATDKGRASQLIDQALQQRAA